MVMWLWLRNLSIRAGFTLGWGRAEGVLFGDMLHP